MQNLEVKDAILTAKKTKSENKKELEDSMVKRTKTRIYSKWTKIVQQNKRMQQKLFKHLKKSSEKRKVT